MRQRRGRRWTRDHKGWRYRVCEVPWWLSGVLEDVAVWLDRKLGVRHWPGPGQGYSRSGD